MNLTLILWVIVELIICCNLPTAIAPNATYSKDVQLISKSKTLSRKRRYVAFPEGASFSIAVCSTIGLIGNPRFNIFSYGLNWGVAYDLPNQTWVLNHLNGFESNKMKPKSLLNRRHRRELYQKLEHGINNIGYNGRQCILRTLCESSKIFVERENNMILEIMRIVFRSKILSSEHPDTALYDRAFQQSHRIEDCASFYKECNFSLIELMLGKFSLKQPRTFSLF